MARRTIIPAAVLLVAGLALVPAAAEDATPVPRATPASPATPACLSRGQQYKIGDYACLPGCHGRQRYARCDVVETSASWIFISDVCPMALRSKPTPGENSPVPVKTAMSEIPVQLAATPAAKEVQAQGPYCDEEFH